jgi:hypothetical protein
MATFYILPSRSLLGQRFAEFLASVFPGLDWQRPEWRDLAEQLGANVPLQTDVYVVYREDLADNADVDRSLLRDFGAEFGDTVVEVSLGGRLAILTARHRRVGQDSQRAA